jgi:hypothetical protein
VFDVPGWDVPRCAVSYYAILYLCCTYAIPMLCYTYAMLYLCYTYAIPYYIYYLPTNQLTYQTTYLPTYQLTNLLPSFCLPAYLLTYFLLPTYQTTYLPNYLLTKLPTYQTTYLPNYLLTKLPTYLLSTYLTVFPISLQQSTTKYNTVNTVNTNHLGI